jgi:membrane complex biogenesis BtpA family protein
MEAVLEQACHEARLYREAGVDAVLVENMHDVPYLKGAVGPEVTAAMALVARAVKAESGLPTGIQILAGANREALAVACAAGLDFIRAEGFVFAHVADEGLMESCAGELLRYRRALGAERVAVYADIKKKHSSHALTADVDLAETARAAAFFGADGVIVTGVATGAETDVEEVRAVRRAVSVPVLVGSGVTEANVERFLGLAHALVVGSHFKVEGRWDRAVEPARVHAFMARVRAWREGRS